MKKSNLVVLIVVVVLVVLVAGWIILRAVSAPQYSAVYLTTGDLYFGKLVHFPSYGIKQVYTIQVNQQSQENPLSIQRFKNVFWGPEDFIRINREHVVWTVGLDSEGQLAELLRTNPDLQSPQQQAPTQGGQLPGGTAPQNIQQ